jgi:hypothetical protein
VTSHAPGVLAALAASTVLVLSACGGDDEPAASQDTAPETSETTSGTQSPTETPEETPTVAAADGIRLAVEGMTVRAPRGWFEGPDFGLQASAAPRGDVGTILYLVSFPVIDGIEKSLDELARESTRSGGWQNRAKRQEDTVIDGEDAFHLSGEVNPGEHVELYGAIVDDTELTLEFSFEDDDKQAYRDEVVESVLASVDFSA